MHLPVLFSGASLVLRDEVVRADLMMAEGVIAAIGGERAAGATLVECADCFILPGFVDLHTDNVERHLEPRPGSFWPARRALLAHDAELAGAGITTAFDAITLGGGFQDARRQAATRDILAALARARDNGSLRIDHHLHLRCELSDPELVSLLDDLASRPAPTPRLVSLMNHTPGQRQWRDPARFRAHYARRYGLSASELDLLIARRQEASAAVVPENARAAIAFARRHGARLSSHDDTEPEDVAAAVRAGCVLAEFPTSAVAAARAHAAGLAVLAGAPNLVSGGSHAGNVSAAALADAGHLDILSSDYIPSSLVQAVFHLHGALGWPLAAAARRAAFSPARVAGLTDRGEIRVGCRADVIVVSQTDAGPVIRETWSAGRRVF